MTSPRAPEPIASRDNPRVKRLRRLVQDGSAYRREGIVWVEGDHLCRALLARGWQPEAVVSSPAGLAWVQTWQQTGALAPEVPVWLLTEALMAQLSPLESATHVGCLVPVPPNQAVQAGVPTVVLDRLQDPGNVGSILRSAAAFGFRQVVALRGTAALWSPKVLRAGMGAHFGLALVEAVDASCLADLQVPLLATSSHHGDWLHEARLPWPCAWLLGHEGQGVRPDLMAQAAQTVRIIQPGGEESLNVAAAAAICLHASAAAVFRGL
ncbi:rRNA methyltransferase [Tepidimonas fonticaldi]|uniref:rRNA methyltransferase n=1 Tax=Tepidimonas fonticaldi TaxID=1101373 RepID=A0A1A6DYU7_9BURK|nr:RNA methyltransferase [Tepidimonas fonticaldi]OBS31950.1 rRNA methyltransferase [Tepidimonas fonticaldi]